MKRVLRDQVVCTRVECLSEVPLHVLFCKLGGKRLHEKKLFQADHFVSLIQFYNQSRKRKWVLQHLQTQTKKCKIDVKSMFSSNFIQKSSVSFKQPIGKNIASFFTKMPNPLFLKQSYDSTCSHTPQQLVTGNTNTMSTSSTNVFGNRPIDILTSTRILKKDLICVPNSKKFFKIVKYQFPSFIKLSENSKM